MQPSSRVQVSIPADGRKLEGELIVPGDASGVVAFAHGSGSSRHSPRNQFVARELQQAGLATLLLDLLEEPGALEEVARQACRWFVRYLSRAGARQPPGS